MNIIKLNAIDSTNAYLKKMLSNTTLEEYTVVVAKQQISGRGQMGTVWQSERGKNLTFSVLLCFNNFKATNQFYLSMAVALAVREVLSTYVTTKIAIKWPNDILSDTEKISGILIENRLLDNTIKDAVVGVGINVNQTNFTKFERKATSLKIITKKEFDLDLLLDEILKKMKHYVSLVKQSKFAHLKQLYLENLYKYNIPSMFFLEKDTKLFLGKIVGIENDGKLILELEDETFCKFDLKQIQFAK